MKLDSLKPVPGSVSNRKRRGRGHGTGLGKSAGRGDKGAGQRSGYKRRPWFEGGQMPLYRRLPKRGFVNLFKKDFQIVNLDKLNRIKSDEINAQLLFESGLVRSPFKPIKILGGGVIDKAIKIYATEFSTSAKEKIEKSGGEAIKQ